MKKAKDVNEYIASAPKDLQHKLKEVRRAIKEAAPAAKESISYQMPYYEYKGRLAYFGLAKAHIGLYIPPPIIQKNKKRLAGYGTTISAVHLPLDKKTPVALIKALVKARMRWNEESM